MFFLNIKKIAINNCKKKINKKIYYLYEKKMPKMPKSCHCFELSLSENIYLYTFLYFFIFLYYIFFYLKYF